LGVKRGNWQVLSQPNYIDQRTITEETTNLPNGVSPTLSGKTSLYFVLLMVNHEEALLSFQFSKASKAQKVAERITKEFDVPLKGEQLV
jgi:hypothetical protein